MTSELKSTILKISIHRDNINPVFGEGATHVSIDDEGGGGFIVIENGEGKLRLELNELELITKTARKLLNQYVKYKI